MKPPVVSLIAVVGRNGVIGKGNALPWRLPTDLKRFKALTTGKPLVMGRKTFDSIGKPLPGRFSIVVTRDRAFAAPDVEVAYDLADALSLARAHGGEEIFVGGGGEIYSQAIGAADRLYITEVDLAPEGDVCFPLIDRAIWEERQREAGIRGPRDEADFIFVTYERR